MASERVALCAESDFKSNVCGTLRQTINFVWPYTGYSRLNTVLRFHIANTWVARILECLP